MPAANLGCRQNIPNVAVRKNRQKKLHSKTFSNNAKLIGLVFPFFFLETINDRRLYYLQSIRHKHMHFALISNDERFVNETLNVFHYAAS